MNKYYLINICVVGLLVVSTGCKSTQWTDADNVEAKVLAHTELSFLEKDIQYGFGGISGLDYNSESNEFIAISDDKGELGPPRVYRFGLTSDLEMVTPREIDLSKTFMSTQLPDTFDAEAVRFLSSDKIIWSSETGDVFITDLAKNSTVSFKLPSFILPDSDSEIGARTNKFIEGITLLGDNKVIFSLEAPLKQDGKVATATSGALSRIQIFGFAEQKLVSEYYYPLDPIPFISNAKPPLQDNGVSEILMIGENRLLVLERAGRHIGEMEFEYDVRCYLVIIPTMQSPAERRTMENEIAILDKTFLFNLGDHINPQLNYEGVTVGEPSQEQDSERTILYLIHDNGFEMNQKTFLTKLSLKMPAN